ncbi:hypothetical protein [Falsiroseomonas stagni]|uniref:Uncharacterized protein n=1 Tax=Falsiroseomonas stagni DSM 19981 TaxID=1123062 RepID=A0A1I4F8T3_9PROT|nr:hypothetical protein [Falsiroseomonas stagni]SFL13257.1 hypothetical protein SAMN02745775_12338 [Falsiroseomonas stagni DSM 19981]
MNTDAEAKDGADPDEALLERLLMLQADDAPQVAPIAPARMAAIATAPGSMTAEERAVLLLSPASRHAFVEAGRAAAGRMASNDNLFFRAAGLAASDGGSTGFEIRVEGWASLTVRPGPAAVASFLLALTLDPAVPGGRAGRHVAVRSEQTGLVWLSGITDAEGCLRAPWSHGAGTPPRLGGEQDLRLQLDDRMP